MLLDLVMEKAGEDQLDWLSDNEEVLRGVKEERNITHTVKRRKAGWIGHILRRNWLLKHVSKENLKKKRYKWLEE